MHAANPLSNHQSPKILFPGPLIQPVNSSERAREDTKTHLLSFLQSDFGFHCFSVRFLFFVFFYWWIRVRHFHISHNAPYLPPPPPPPPPLKFCITFVFYFSWLPPPPPPPRKFCITFVFYFSWLLQPYQEKLKTMLLQNFAGQIRCIMGSPRES